VFRAGHLGFHTVRCPLLRMTLGRGTLCSQCDTSTPLIGLEPAVVTRDKRISSAHAVRRVRGRRERCHERSRCTSVHALVTHTYSHFLGFQMAGYTVQFPGMRLSTVHGVTDCALGARRARGQHLSRRRDSRRRAEQTVQRLMTMFRGNRAFAATIYFFSPRFCYHLVKVVDFTLFTVAPRQHA
jgi:hypothetical protein